MFSDFRIGDDDDVDSFLLLLVRPLLSQDIWSQRAAWRFCGSKLDQMGLFFSTGGPASHKKATWGANLARCAIGDGFIPPRPNPLNRRPLSSKIGTTDHHPPLTQKVGGMLCLGECGCYRVCGPDRPRRAEYRERRHCPANNITCGTYESEKDARGQRVERRGLATRR
jgi:hypothetical protein